MNDYYKTEDEIQAVVAGFENCTTGKEDFSHLSHLTVATYYLCHSNPADSLEKIRSGLFRFLDYHGISRQKYKEQLTRDWIDLVQGVVEQMGAEASVVNVANEVIRKFGRSRIPGATNTES